MKSENYDLTCMLCGTTIGQFLSGKFVPRAGRAPVRRANGQLRCSQCGGSLYLDLIDAYASSFDPEVQADRIEAETRKQARRSPLGAVAHAEGANSVETSAALGAV